MPTIWGYFAFDFLFGGAGPLQPPHDLRFAHASAFGAGQVSLNWAWERPDEIGPGATDVTYQTEVQELSAAGAVLVAWTSRAPHTGADLDREIRVPVSANRWELRVRAVNNATPPESSDWVVSLPHPAQIDSRLHTRQFGRAFA